jgi:hypothetical protein
MEFNNKTDCVICKRYIDDVIVMLKKITVGPDNSSKFEKLCSDCYYGKRERKEEKC